MSEQAPRRTSKWLPGHIWFLYEEEPSLPIENGFILPRQRWEKLKTLIDARYAAVDEAEITQHNQAHADRHDAYPPEEWPEP